MRPVLVLCLAACSSDREAPRSEPATAANSAPLAPLGPIRGSHGGAITALAVTADGRAAVSTDTTGGVRLWPALDGSREPIVIYAARPTALAIAHDGGGFAIALVDAADHVELVRVDARGGVRSRRSLGAAVQVELIGDSVLVLRPDQIIERIALDGSPRGRLEAERGTQIDAIVARDDRVLALIDSAKDTHARWIDLATFTWGKASAPLSIAEHASIVLVPAHDAIVARGSIDNHIMRFELATGTAKPVCPTGLAPAGSGRHHRSFDLLVGGERIAEPLAVIGDRVACLVDRTFTWWHVDTGASTTASLGEARQQLAFAAASDRLVFGSGHQLAIHTPERIDYLGYGFRDLTHVRAVPTGLVIGKGDQQPVLLDDEFRERARFVLPKLRVDWVDLVPLDDRFILTSSTRPSGDTWGSAYQIAVYDSVKQVMHQVLPHQARSGELAYEPATKLLAASDGAKTMLIEVDPAQHTLGNDVVLELPAPPHRLVLVDPVLARGLVAIAVYDHGAGGIDVLPFHRADLPPRSERGGVRRMRARGTFELSGELRAIDRAGRLYVVAGDDVAVHAGARRVATLPKAGRAQLRPSPDGKQVVAVENGTITLFASEGSRRWQIAAWGTSDVDWLANGTLYARSPNALARIDVATGALRERQCGWAFGIAPTPRDSSALMPSVCDVAP